MDIGRDQQSRKLAERDQARAIDGYATAAKLLFNPIGLRTSRIQPEFQPIWRLLSVARVSLDECCSIMGNAPVARIENYSGAAAQLVRKGQRDQPWREYDR